MAWEQRYGRGAVTAESYAAALDAAENTPPSPRGGGATEFVGPTVPGGRPVLAALGLAAAAVVALEASSRIDGLVQMAG